jgi:anti-sigma-K factor RskA
MTARTPISMTCDDVSEALPAYALGVLEPEENQAVAHHLETCPHCRAELAPFERVADSLALAPAPSSPPPDLRTRLLASAQAPRPVAAEISAGPATRPDRSILMVPRWVVWPLAAAAVLMIAGIAVLSVLFAQARNDRDEARSAGYQLAAYLSAGGTATKLLAATTDGKYYGHGSLVTAPNLPPIVVVGGCSPTKNDRLYRVWVARGNDRTRIGELTVGADGEGWIKLDAGEPLNTYDTVGITMITGDDERQDVLVGQVVQTTTG